ncbi:MAG: glutamate racemase [Nitrospirae bacterium]|nr:glutamate racemase [Nitrospirota bacterium]
MSRTSPISGDSRPIGVFDSGVGGLTVLRAIHERLPKERLIYLGDTARVPYGTKSRETVIRYAVESTIFLTSRNIKALVIACNTSTAYALDRMKKTFNLPVIGVIEPGVKQALLKTVRNRIGVIGTAGTVASGAYQRELRARRPDARVTAQACPLFVALAEEGWSTGRIAEETARRYLLPLRKRRLDTLVLGCTHYPLLKSTIRKVMGPGVLLVDSAEAVAEEVESVLGDKQLLAEGSGKGSLEIFATDVGGAFRRVAEKFLGRPLREVKRARI